MRKLITIILILICSKSFAQVYQLMPQYGYQANRFVFDSTLQIPTTCGVPTLKSVQFATKKAAIAFDSCNNRFYQYNPKTQAWSQVSGGGGSETDTTSLSNRINLKLNISDTAAMLNPYLKKIDTATLSNRINLKIDSVKRRRDSVFAYRNGTEVFQFKDSVGTNPPPNGYYGAFQDNTTQTAASANTATAVKFNTTDLSNGVSVVNNGGGNPTRVTIANAGVYNIQFSLQLEKISGSGNYVIDIWLRKNGTNVEGTTGKIVLTGSANASPVVAAWNYVLQLASNDYVQLMWSTSNTNAVIISESASTPYPSVPSSIITITQQSGIMAGTGISPLDTANMLLPYLRKADTTVFQRKQLPAYSIMGNNTNAAANPTAVYYKDTAGTYTGTITFTATTAPSGTTNHSYRWTRIGNQVTLNVSLVYSVTGGSVSQVVITLPSDAPAPAKPAGLTAASNTLYPVIYQLVGNISANPPNATQRAIMRTNAANNGYEIVGLNTGTTIIAFYFTVQYTAQ